MNVNDMNRSESKKSHQPAHEISTLTRREIQSPLIACLIRGFISEIGRDKAMEVTSAAIQKRGGGNW